MPTYTTYSCPKCFRTLGAGTNLLRLGSPIIRCGYCGTLIKTGFHKHATAGDKLNAAFPIILGIGVLLGFLYGTIAFGSSIMLLLGFLLGGFSVIIGIHNLSLVKKYENSAEAKSNGIPTY
jgi:DNA-directed RNA polymerase subunit RPC12/RpoP